MVTAPFQITIESTLRLLRESLEPLDFIHSMWEGGSTAFGRND